MDLDLYSAGRYPEERNFTCQEYTEVRGKFEALKLAFSSLWTNDYFSLLFFRDKLFELL